MKYCKQCGKQLEDTASFCTSCGAKQENVIRKEAVEESKTEQKFGRKGGLIVLIVLAVIIISVILYLVLFRNPELKVQDTAKATEEENNKENITDKQVSVETDNTMSIEESFEEESEISSEEVDIETEESFISSETANRILEFNEEARNLGFYGTFSEAITGEWWNEDTYPEFMPKEETTEHAYHAKSFEGAYVWCLANGDHETYTLMQFKDYGYLSLEDVEYHFVEANEGEYFILGRNMEQGFSAGLWKYDINNMSYTKENLIGAIVLTNMMKVNVTQVYREDWSPCSINIFDKDLIPQTVIKQWRYELIGTNGVLIADIWTNGDGNFLYQTYDSQGYVTWAGEISSDNAVDFNNGKISGQEYFAIGIVGGGMSNDILHTGNREVHWDSFKGELWSTPYTRHHEEEVASLEETSSQIDISKINMSNYEPQDFVKADIVCTNSSGEIISLGGVDIFFESIEDGGRCWVYKLRSEVATGLVHTDHEDIRVQDNSFKIYINYDDSTFQNAEVAIKGVDATDSVYNVTYSTKTVLVYE